MSEAELAERKSEAFDRYLEGIGLAADAAISGEFTQDWMESGSVTRRTSLIVGPDGTMPPLTPQAEARRAAVRASGDRPLDSHEDRPLGERCLKFATGGPPMRDSHEDRPLGERCLKFATGGPPMSPFVFLSLVHILQTPEHVALIVEENHATRVVPLDGRSHIDPRLRLWRGNSVGRWEGETLVIETTNFSGKGGYRGAGEGLRLTERLRRLDADTVLYGFTVNDPDTLGSTVDG